ncbi:MAG: NAD(P)H-hydrate epimerase [Pseudomonadota bacterium]
MTELLTAAQMRAIERAAIDSGEVTGLELMERAGRGAVEAIFEWRPGLAACPHGALVLCGPGNNGGDGFVVARLLHERGWAVELFLYGRDPAEIDKLPPDAAINARRWAELGEIHSASSHAAWLTDLSPTGTRCQPVLVIDALFGGGLSRPLGEDAKELLASSRRTITSDVVAIDAPSGLCLDSGRFMSRSGDVEAHAALTVTFHVRRRGHYLAQGLVACGDLHLVDIGLDRNLALRLLEGRKPGERRGRDDAAITRSTAGTRELGKGLHGPEHKYDHGHALIISGGVGKGGAARLAARGALRIGAGLVTVGCPPAAVIENAARLDAIMLRSVKDPRGLAAILADKRINAVCLGPGFGVGQGCRAMVAAALGAVPEESSTGGLGVLGAIPLGQPEGAEPNRGGAELQPQPASSTVPRVTRALDEPGAAGERPRPAVVLDADALTSFADDPDALFAMLHGRCVLTPHEGEFGRLFPDILAKLQQPATRGPAYSKVDATREAAARAGCVVLFKGADTVISDPSGRCAINDAHHDRAAPWLATAGSGDVLAGFIAGLLARGFSPMDAAATAAWLHVECALKVGPGLIAEDLPEQLPAVFRDLDL